MSDTGGCDRRAPDPVRMTAGASLVAAQVCKVVTDVGGDGRKADGRSMDPSRRRADVSGRMAGMDGAPTELALRPG